MNISNRNGAVPRLLAALAVTALSCVARAASGCDPVMSERAAHYETSIDVQGRERVSRDVVLPGAPGALAFVTEQGIDVTLEVERAGQRLARAESPVERTGLHRAAFAATDGGRFTFSIIGREHARARGTVRLRVLAMTRAELSGACYVAQQALARADAAYAAGRAASESTVGKAPVDSASSYALAQAAYLSAARALEARGPSLLQAQAHHARAALFNYQIQDWTQASASAAQAMRAYSASGDEYGGARAKLIKAEADIELAIAPSIAGADSDAGSEALARVRQDLQAIASFHAQRAEPYEQASALNNVGVTYHLAGRYEDALRAYRRAVPLYEQLRDTTGEARVLQNISLVEYELGRLSDSIPHYARVLELLGRDDNPVLFASILSNSALANSATGNYDTALRQLNEALPILRAAGDKYWEARVLNHTGVVYDGLGDQARALELYREALTLRTTSLDPRGRVSSLRTIGNILRDQGRADEALKMHQEALKLASGSARKRVLVQIARDLMVLGRPDEAVQQLTQVLARPIAGDDVDRARALAVRGQHRASAGEHAAAEKDLRSALRIFRTYEQTEDELDAWVELARSMRARGQSSAALAAIDEALALAEDVRVQSANPELRATLLQPLRPAFDLKISMLTERYFAAGVPAQERQALARQALLTAESARARALLDFQTLDLSAPGVRPELANRRQSIYRELAARRFRLTAALDRSGTEDARVRTIRADIAALRQELDGIDAQLASASSAATAVRQRGGSPEVRLPGGDVTVVEYWLGADEALAWVIRGDQVTLNRLGPAHAINEAARAFHTALRSFGTVPQSERLATGERLYEQVVRPLGATVLEKRKLVFIPDGALHYVPFAALRARGPARTQFLVETHDIAVAPSVRMLALQTQRSRTPPRRQMLLVADPVYSLSDARLGRLASRVGMPPRETLLRSAASLLRVRGAGDERDLPRLPGTAQEAATIAALLPGENIVRLEGFAATRDSFLQAGLDQYRFIHIASHAVSDAETPQASALILSRFDARSRALDGNVLAADFIHVKFNAQTVVLSACDTAVGKNIAGEGLIGLRYLVLARGAQSVIASLWPASDQATAQVMAHFYAPLLREDAAVEAAFATALRRMIAGTLKDPGLWGAFALTVSRLETHRTN